MREDGFHRAPPARRSVCDRFLRTIQAEPPIDAIGTLLGSIPSRALLALPSIRPVALAKCLKRARA